MFHIYELTLDLLTALAPVLAAIKRHDADLARQLQRASTGVVLNVGESRGRKGGDRRRLFEYAHGSTYEVASCCDAAERLGWIQRDPELRRLIARVLGGLQSLQR